MLRQSLTKVGRGVLTAPIVSTGLARHGAVRAPRPTSQANQHFNNSRMSSTSGYKLVKLASAVHSVHSLAHQETFHPVIGPMAEAEALYVRQLQLAERLRQHEGEFVIWDVGLGAAANAITVLRQTQKIPAAITLVSFDNTLEPLKFALEHRDSLGYLAGYEKQIEKLCRERNTSFANDQQSITWQVHFADFPTLLAQSQARDFPRPHAIMFDAFSPAKNPAMWTQPLFANIFHLLDPLRPCALPTYSRSTMLRGSLLLAGFYVGVEQMENIGEE